MRCHMLGNMAAQTNLLHLPVTLNGEIKKEWLHSETSIDRHDITASFETKIKIEAARLPLTTLIFVRLCQLFPA